jgi:hypothetical protein
MLYKKLYNIVENCCSTCHAGLDPGPEKPNSSRIDHCADLIISAYAKLEDSMEAKDIIGEAFQKCIDFHGHLCPGLSLMNSKSCIKKEVLKYWRRRLKIYSV